MRRLWLALNALGARWGVFSEDAFRSGVRELLRDAGYAVERWVYYDDRGYVYGYPSEVESSFMVIFSSSLLKWSLAARLCHLR
jgi:hypothetical protein